MRKVNVFAIAAFAAATAFGVLPCRFLHEMTGEYVTPHHDFRGTAAEKPLKVLFLLDRAGGRDAVEAVQRFNIEPTYFMMVYGDRIAVEDMYESAWEGTTVYEKTCELDGKLNAHYDLYVFGRKTFTSVNEEHRYRILKAVRDGGAGLLMVNDIGPHRIPYGKVYENPLPMPEFAERFPSEFANTQFRSWRLGKGRVAELAWRGDSQAQYFALVPKFPIDDLWPAKYENAIAFAGQAMRYTAGRAAEPSAPLRVRYRDRFNRIASGLSCAGRHFKDTIGANGAVLVEKVDVPSPVGGLSVEAPDVMKGGTLSARATWRMPVERVKSVLFETLESPSMRVMSRIRKAVAPGAVSQGCDIPDARVSTKAGYVRVTLEDANGRPIEIAERLVFFPRRQLDDYVQMGWDTVVSMHPFAGAPVVVDRLGFTCGLTHPTFGGANIAEMAVLNQSAVPYVTRIAIDRAEDGSAMMRYWNFLDKDAQKRQKAIVGDDCFYRPEVQECWRDMMRFRLRNLPKCAPPFYNLGDENCINLEAGFGGYCDKYFREFLRDKYGTIENLNRNWKTNCTDFASVPHIRLDEAKRIGNLAAWADHRAYMNKMYADIHSFCREEIRKIDPGALVGAEGSVPGDLERTIENLEFWGPYSDLVEDEALRSFGGNRIRMLWWGGYPSSHGGRGLTPFPLSLMNDLAKGTVMGNAWFAINVGQNHGFFYSDLKIADDVAQYIGWHDRFKDGLAQLLIRNPLRNDGILLYWSHSSQEASVASEKCLSPNDGLSTLIKHCYRSGRSFEFVSARTLARLKDARALFLCGATALSDVECAAIRAFAKRGGTVVADVEPAVMNENLAWRDGGALADLWGSGRCVKLDRKLSLAYATEKTPGSFDREIAAHLPPPADGSPVGVVSENAILRVREGRGFEIVTAMWPVSELGAKAKVSLPGHRFIYAPCEGFAGETDGFLELDFANSPFVCRTVFAERQAAPQFDVTGCRLGGDVTFKMPPPVSGRVFCLTVRDGAGNVRMRAVFDREEKLPKRLCVAWNDMPGTWTATLVDCATGLKAEKTFEVAE